MTVYILSHAYHCVSYWVSITANLNGIFLQNQSSVLHSPLSDLVKLLWVTDKDLDSHLHFGLLQTEVQASNLGIKDALYHAFRQTERNILLQETVYI